MGERKFVTSGLCHIKKKGIRKRKETLILKYC